MGMSQMIKNKTPKLGDILVLRCGGDDNPRHGIQKATHLYSTKALAMRALRAELSHGFALTLAEIDDRIIAIENGEAKP